MRLTDTHGIDWIRNRDGTWRQARPDEIEAHDDPEGYMSGWYNGLMCGLTICAIVLVVLAFIATYTKYCVQ